MLIFIDYDNSNLRTQCYTLLVVVLFWCFTITLLCMYVLQWWVDWWKTGCFLKLLKVCIEITYYDHTWAGEKSLGGFLPIPICYKFWFWFRGRYTCNVNFWALGGGGGKHPSKTIQRACVIMTATTVDFHWFQSNHKFGLLFNAVFHCQMTVNGARMPAAAEKAEATCTTPTSRPEPTGRPTDASSGPSCSMCCKKQKMATAAYFFVLSFFGRRLVLRISFCWKCCFLFVKKRRGESSATRRYHITIILSVAIYIRTYTMFVCLCLSVTCYYWLIWWRW